MIYAELLKQVKQVKQVDVKDVKDVKAHLPLNKSNSVTENRTLKPDSLIRNKEIGENSSEENISDISNEINSKPFIPTPEEIKNAGYSDEQIKEILELNPKNYTK